MESAYEIYRNEIFMNCLVVWGENVLMFRSLLTFSTKPENWSIHVVVRTRTAAKKCTKMKNALAGSAELLFLLIRVIFLLSSCRRCRRPCVSSLVVLRVS